MHKVTNKYRFISNLLPAAIYIFICSIGLVITFYPTLISGFKRMQTDPGDTWLVNYFLEHSFQLFINNKYIGSLWSPPFFYPYPNVLTFSENLFGVAPIYWLFRAFFLPDLAFQLWVITLSILCFNSFAFLLRRFSINHLLSAFGAFLFTFSMPRLAQIGRQQLLPQFFTPLVLLVAWEFFKQPTIIKLALFLLLTYLQVLSAIYLGWFLLFSLLIFFGIAYTLSPEARLKALEFCKIRRTAILSTFLCWTVSMFFTLLPYIQTKSVLGARPYSEVDNMLPRINSWFSVPAGSLWSSLLGWTSQDLPMPAEHQMFAGMTIILLTCVCIYSLLRLQNLLTAERVLLVKICLLIFIIIFLLTLRFPNGFSLWKLVYELVPGASVIRVVTRIWLIAYFYLLVAVIVCFDSLLREIMAGKRLRKLIITLVCIIGILEQVNFKLPSYEKAPVLKQVTEISSLIRQDCDLAYVSLSLQKSFQIGAYASLKSEQLFWVDQLSAMWAGIESNVPIINGYSGNVPPAYGDISHTMNTFQVIKWLERFNIKNKKLCMVFHKSLENNKDYLMTTYAQKNNISASGSWVSHVIQVPVTQVFSHEIQLLNVPKTLPKEIVTRLPILLKNSSNFLWSPDSISPTHFSYRWLNANHKVVVADGERTSLPYDLYPGETLALNVTIKTPPQPGKYKLMLTMVQEGIAWFADKGAKAVEIPVEVIIPS